MVNSYRKRAEIRVGVNEYIEIGFDNLWNNTIEVFWDNNTIKIVKGNTVIYTQEVPQATVKTACPKA